MALLCDCYHAKPIQDFFHGDWQDYDKLGRLVDFMKRYCNEQYSNSINKSTKEAGLLKYYA